MRTRTIAAAMMLAYITSADAHSWYDDKCCHDKDCHPVPCEEIEKPATAGSGATRRPNNATGFRTTA
jgi:hypothetical protein